jgi:hypothetical protein
METQQALFSVRSTYHGEWKHQFENKERNLQAPGRSRINDVWDILWKTSVAAKIKMFAWKNLHGILACYGVLANRHIPISGQCPRCSIHCEDIKHVLFECEHAATVWSKLGLLATIQNVLHVDRAGSAILEELLSAQHQGDTRELILTSAWYIWWMRRQGVYDEHVPPSMIAAMSIQVIT